MLSSKDKDVIRSHVTGILLFTTLLVAASAFIYWNPFRWYWSALFILCVYILIMFLGRRLHARLRRTVTEQEQIAIEDKLLGLDKEPSKDWYFFP